MGRLAMEKRYARGVHIAFRIGIFLKGLDGLLEIIGGTLLFFIPPETIHWLLRLTIYQELSENPKDFLAHLLLRASRDFSARSQFFGSLFLLSHGIIKLFLIVALFRKKLWAYPVAMAVFGLFIVYQMYRYALSQSIWMVFLSGLDVLVIGLTYLEYRNLETLEILEPSKS
jgi:uncharacterized membrane protein